jgi:hypothetical protein
LPNRLTPLYSKNHYKEKNYLTIRTGSLYTWLLPIVIVEYINMFSTSVHQYINTFSTQVHSVYKLWLITWLSYPSSHSSTGSIPLISLLRSHFNSLITNTTGIPRFITLAPSSLALSLKILFISKSLIRGILCPILI